MAKQNTSYNEAFGELTRILETIENKEPDMDSLTAQVKKAAELVKFCKSKLFETEAEIEKILEDLDHTEK
ncbi:MAG: exodeoxyribonuclease VII small subunit [Bacteroidota bacterium]|nr:MAG: exodeoxyribonuclease VII small subunit [Bacteroidota bacterium]